MDYNTIAIFVALVPGIAAAVLGFLIAVLPTIKAKFDELINDPDDLDWLAALTFEFAFIGSAAVGYLFAKHEEFDNLVLTGVWFATWLYFNRLLLGRKKDLELIAAAEAAKTQRNKQAGLLRSIVKSELEKAAMNRGDAAP